MEKTKCEDCITRFNLKQVVGIVVFVLGVGGALAGGYYDLRTNDTTTQLHMQRIDKKIDLIVKAMHDKGMINNYDFAQANTGSKEKYPYPKKPKSDIANSEKKEAVTIKKTDSVIE